jgi:hypothetical protein
MKISIRMPLLFGRQAQDIEGKARPAVSGTSLSTRLALAMVSLVVVTTAVLSLMTYHFVTEAAIPRSLDRLATKAMLCATKLETALNVARQDVMVIQGSTGVIQMGVARAANPSEPLSDKPLRDSIAARFLAALVAKPDYAQLRIIGVADGGRELLRVDRRGPGGTPRIVPEAELIQAGDRDYFKRTIGLSKSDVYVSPVELQKAGETEGPAVPMLHVAIPLWTPHGEPFAISVIDFDMGPKFDRVRVEMGGKGNQVFIANGAGDYLLHPDRSREFAFEAGIPVRIQSDFPGFEVALAGGAANDSGIWTDRSGVRYGVGWAAVHLAGGTGLTILVATTYSNLTVGRAAANVGVEAGHVGDRHADLVGVEIDAAAPHGQHVVGRRRGRHGGHLASAARPRSAQPHDSRIRIALASRIVRGPPRVPFESRSMTRRAAAAPSSCLGRSIVVSRGENESSHG